MKGFRHVNSKTIYRRIKALEREHWIVQRGNRPTRPGWPSELYEVTLKGIAALKLDRKSIDEFLEVASNEQLSRLIEVFS